MLFELFSYGVNESTVSRVNELCISAASQTHFCAISMEASNQGCAIKLRTVNSDFHLFCVHVHIIRAIIFFLSLLCQYISKFSLVYAVPLFGFDSQIHPMLSFAV